MSNKKDTKPAAAAAPTASADDMDGGFTYVDGQKMRIILDGRGVFKAHVPAGGALPEPSSLDEASERARAQIPLSKTLGAGGQGGAQGEDLAGLPSGPAGGPGTAGGFKAPT